MDEAKYKKLGRSFAKINLVFALTMLGFLYFHPESAMIIKIFKTPITVYSWFTLGSCILLFIKPNSLLLSLGFFNFIYLIIEVVTYIVIGFQTTEIQWEGFNRPSSKYDAIAGYLWDNTDSCRITRLAKGEIIYDQKFLPNNKGYISKTNYHFNKQGKKRYILFGDSFSCAEFLENPLGDKLNELAQKDSLNIEFYSFAQDGAGVSNWHNIYFNDIITNYEFDGIILASWFDNWKRPFSTFHMEPEGGYFQRSESVIGKEFSEIKDFITQDKFNLWSIATDKEIDEMIKTRKDKQFFSFHRPSMDFTIKVCIAVEKFYLRMSGKTREDIEKKQVPVNEQYFKDNFRPELLAKFDALIEHAKNNNKEVIITSIPRKSLANPRKHKARNIEKVSHEMELEFYANKYNTTYVSGYKPFHDLESEELFLDHWLFYDGHWNQKGLDLYANHFYQKLFKN